MTEEWTPAQIALVLSGMSFVISVASFLWNVWSKFIYPKPKLEIYAGYFVSGRPTEPETDHFIMITVVNHGPLAATVKLLIGQAPSWHTLVTRRFRPFIIKHFGAQSSQIPPLKLPAKIEHGDETKFMFDGRIDWFSKEPKFQVGIVDVFGRKFFVPMNDMRKIKTSQSKYQ